ncbi:MAG: sugar phosphate nucleotidyltransferase [Candidatus Bipolaricaulota bacterium]
MRAVVLAGGYAKRLWPITLDRPKPLLPVAGRPLLDWIMDRIPAGSPPLLSVNRRFAQAFADWARGRPVELVVEETRSEEEKLGSMGALGYVVERTGVDDDLLVIGGDNLFEAELGGFVEAFRGQTIVALHDLADPAEARLRYGVAVVEEGRVVGFQEKPRVPRSALVSTACFLFPRHVLPLFREYLVSAEAGHDTPGYFLEWLLLREPIEPFMLDGGWYDIGNRETYIEANLRHTGGKSWIHPEAEVEDSVVERSVVLGPCQIENSRLTGCVVDEGARLLGVHLRDVLIGRASWLRGDG